MDPVERQGRGSADWTTAPLKQLLRPLVRLPRALVRPGRVDLNIYVGLASKACAAPIDLKPEAGTEIPKIRSELLVFLVLGAGLPNKNVLKSTLGRPSAAPTLILISLC